MPALLLVVLIVLALPVPRAAAGDTYRIVAPDGTVHYTNAPNDPRYRRLRGLSGSQQGLLNLRGASADRYRDEITAAADRYGVDRRLVEAVIRAESAFNPRALSRKGAQGLMQLMPTTASMLGVQDAFDPRQNIEAGVRHLSGLIERYARDLRLALAAYNAGHQAVAAHGGVPPYPETRRYVDRILRDVGGVGMASVPRATFQWVDADGTVVYTNIPGRPRR
jgi:soluble lytic murein transglycosylase-like protein